MLNELPQFIEPLRLANKRVTLAGKLPLKAMLRLGESLIEQEGDVTIEWHFCRDAQQRPCIQGTIHADLTLECQRCLQPVTYAFHLNTALMLLREGQPEDDLPDTHEVLTIVDDNPMSLLELIEDELILSLPIVPAHEHCPHNEYEDLISPDPQADELDKPNPFKILENLKKSK